MDQKFCGTFTADIEMAMILSFVDVDTLGRVTVTLEGDVDHLLDHLHVLMQSSAKERLRRLEKE